jgi:hypothetical protein
VSFRSRYILAALARAFWMEVLKRSMISSKLFSIVLAAIPIPVTTNSFGKSSQLLRSSEFGHWRLMSINSLFLAAFQNLQGPRCYAPHNHFVLLFTEGVITQRTQIPVMQPGSV